MKKFGKSIKNLWTLDDSVLYLNHASYGATPLRVIEAAERIQRELEREPVEFFSDKYFEQVRKVIASLAAFVGGNSYNLVLLENATTAINTVLRSLLPNINAQDEIIITNQTYPAVKMACRYISDVSGCKISEVQIPYPPTCADDLINVYRNKISKRTKLVILDHIFYTTGVINPIKEIVSFLKENDVLVLVDGAHVPGMLPLNIESLGVDWYTGNCHKWLFAPKGTAFLWTAPEMQELTVPLSISYYYGQSYTKLFDWTGTRNPSSYLALRDAIDFHHELGSERIFDYIHKLAAEAGDLIASELGLAAEIPADMFGAMVSFELSDVNSKGDNFVNELRKRFFTKYRIEVPFTEFDNKVLIRFAAQIYNELSDYERLAQALKEFLPSIRG